MTILFAPRISAPAAEGPIDLNLRISRSLATAAVSGTDYRLRDFVSARARQDLMSMHQFFARQLEADAESKNPLRAGLGAAEVLGILEDVLMDSDALAPYLAPETPTRMRYLADLGRLARSLREELGG